MADVKKLLRKRKFTGKDLGKLEIANMCYVFGQRLETGTAGDPLFDMNRFFMWVEQYVNPNKFEQKDYGGYLSIHTWIQVNYNIMQLKLLERELHLTKLAQSINCIHTTEGIYEYKSRLPKIMTRRQYDDAKAAGLEDWLYDKEGNAKDCNVPMLLRFVVNYYRSLFRIDPQIPNPLHKIYPQYKTARVQSEWVLKKYQGFFREGHYVLPDGRTSDDLTGVEWRKYVFDNLPQKSILCASKAETDAYAAIWNKRPHEYTPFVDRFPAKWVEVPDYPMGVTKWAMIREGDIYYVFPKLFGIENGTRAEFLAEASEFLSEFQALFDVIAKDIDKKKGLASGERLADMQPEQWGKTVFSAEELSAAGFFGFRRRQGTDDAVACCQGREVANGIAVLLKPHTRPENTDSRGYYKEPEISTPDLLSLESFFDDAPHATENRAQIADKIGELKDALYAVNGFNTLLEETGKAFDIPEVSVFKGAGIEDTVQEYNDLRDKLLQRVLLTDYDDANLKEQKLDTIAKVFPPLSTEEIKMRPEDIEKMRGLFDKYYAFSDAGTLELVNLIYSRPEE